jgi:hypothetical protein
VIVLGLLFFIFLSIKAWISIRLTPNQRFFLIGLTVSILINAWVAATFVYPHNRAGCKLIWLLPFMVILLLLNRKVKIPLTKNN